MATPLPDKSIKKTVIPVLVNEYDSLLQGEGQVVSREVLFSLASSAYEKAIVSFGKLIPPRVCNDLSTYTLFWLRAEFNSFFQEQTLKKVSPGQNEGKQDEYFLAIRDFSSILSLGSFAAKEQQLYGTESFEERKRIYRKYRPTLESLKEPFERLIKSRNQLAKAKGHPDYVSFSVAGHQIPSDEFNRFMASAEEVISYLNFNLPTVKNLPDWFYHRLNKPCLLCRVQFKEPTVPEGVFNVASSLYPQLKQFIPKINLSYEKRSYAQYIKENDTFKLAVSQGVNQRHQTVSLVHELAHVIDFIDCFSREEDLLKRGRYAAEKAAIDIELKVLRSIDPKVEQAYYLDLLLIIHRALFELAIYRNPKQNYSSLYANLFNHCFSRARQRFNLLYLLDETIVSRPLSSLPFAVASVNLILENKKLHG